jgi:hypothetical protein
VIDSAAEEHRPRWGARPSKPLRRVIVSGGFDSCLFRRESNKINRLQANLSLSQQPPHQKTSCIFLFTSRAILTDRLLPKRRSTRRYKGRHKVPALYDTAELLVMFDCADVDALLLKLD